MVPLRWWNFHYLTPLKTGRTKQYAWKLPCCLFHNTAKAHTVESCKHIPTHKYLFTLLLSHWRGARYCSFQMRPQTCPSKLLISFRPWINTVLRTLINTWKVCKWPMLNSFVKVFTLFKWIYFYLKIHYTMKWWMQLFWQIVCTWYGLYHCCKSA